LRDHKRAVEFPVWVLLAVWFITVDGHNVHLRDFISAHTSDEHCEARRKVLSETNKASDIVYICEQVTPD
jgi:hypothetical protein